MDSAYNLGADPIFSDFAHTGSSATIQFFIFGTGNQTPNDESWAMDNLEVGVFTKYGNPSAVPLPAAAWLFGSGIMGLFGLRRKALT